ncbi:MAG: hypothetical protein ACR2L1_03360 [Pyrinomonadaceae bacterium]
MKLIKFFIFSAAVVALATACQKNPTQMNPGGYTGANKINNSYITNGQKPGEGEGAHESADGEHSNTEAGELKEVQRPEKIAEMMRTRGEQDSAKPVLMILEPKANVTVGASTVKVKLGLSGDLKGYQPMKDPATGMGNHIHVILDNQPYEAYYNLNQEFELRNVADGEHTLRVFPSRPWHESFKNEGAFVMVKFNVKNGGADTAKPTTTNSNQAMSSTPAEGKDMASSTGDAVDLSKPLLTYSRPKGEYKGADAENIMVDFWLSNAKLAGDGGEYRARLSIDGREIKMIDKWQPVWFAGWTEGKHSVKLELVDKEGNVVDNGGYNSTTREITVSK